jgi:DNA polymerase III subunit alpha
VLLNCHTFYSFCYGTLSTEELIAAVRRHGYDTFVLSDINSTSAVLDALRVTKDTGPKVIPGIDFRDGVTQRYVGIARNNDGYRELNEHLSQHLHPSRPFGEARVQFSNAYTVYPFARFSGDAPAEHEFIGVSAKDLAALIFSPLKKYADRLVILESVTFASARDFNAHRLLRAIDNNTLLSKLPKTAQGSPDETLRDRGELLAAFAAWPQVIRNTEALLSYCDVTFRFGKLDSKNLRYYSVSFEADQTLLRQKCLEGLPYRYSHASRDVMARLDKELDVIAKMNFASYFLVNWDITNYARHKGYYYVGRGSGANSLAAYLLRITDVDPIDLDLYFERFINEYRSNAPDFDIDFSWTDRDDVTRYIFDRFGKERTALVGSYSTFQHDAVTRELGKVFGLPPQEIEKLQRASDHSKTDHIGRLVQRYATRIQGFPRHLSVHASGILISELPMTTYTATFVPPKGFPTTQFSMLEAEDIGLFKFDILSQRGLAKIRDAIAIVGENRSVNVDVHDVPKFKSDEKIRELLRVGKCIGCFYVESPGMRMLLAKLQADDYLRLVAASSIIRPGVSKSGMMREYIVRYRDEGARKAARAALPELYDLLEETYGVMVYQEDVIRVAHLFAGLSLEEADFLRRGMSWKFKQRNEFWRVKKKFFDNCKLKGHTEQTVQGIWDQIESFANFAFSKGHSASYAVESYQALYLKAHFPLEYMVATLNNGGGFYRPELYVHEARMHGAVIEAPCVNASGAETRIRDNRIILGLAIINGLESAVVHNIRSERGRAGAYAGLYDFISRTGIAIEQVRLLARAGAFRTLGRNKKEILWEAHMLVNPRRETVKREELFDMDPERFDLPALETSAVDDAFDEIELFGFPLQSPFSLLREPITNTLLARDLPRLIGKTVEIIGQYVTTKPTRTGSGERMSFGTFLDQEGRWIDTVHFPQSERQYPFAGPGCYRIIGKVVEEFDFIFIEVSHQYRLPMLNREMTAKKSV